MGRPSATRRWTSITFMEALRGMPAIQFAERIAKTRADA